MEAAQNNEVDAVRAYLEEGGGHVDAADKQLGGTMLMCASSAGNLAIMDMLLNHGASVDVCDANGGDRGKHSVIVAFFYSSNSKPGSYCGLVGT